MLQHWRKRPPQIPKWNIGPKELIQSCQQAIAESTNAHNGGFGDEKFFQWLNQEARLLNRASIIASYARLPSDSVQKASQTAGDTLRRELIDIRSDPSLLDYLDHGEDSILKTVVARRVLYPYIKDVDTRSKIAEHLHTVTQLQYEYMNYKARDGEGLSAEEYVAAMTNEKETVRRSTYEQLVNGAYFHAKDQLALEIFGARAAIAKDLGFESYMDLSLETRFIKGKELRAWIGQQYGQFSPSADKVQSPWNYLYNLKSSEKLVGSPKVPLETTFARILQLVSSLFGVEFEPQDISENGTVWSPSVQLYSLKCLHTKEQVGYTYFDLHKSVYKSPGFSTSVIQHRYHDLRPITCVTCSLEEDIGILDVWSILHEFGHLLHEHLGEARQLGYPKLGSSELDYSKLGSSHSLNLPQFSGTNNTCFSNIEVPSHTVERLIFSPKIAKYLGFNIEHDRLRKFEKQLEFITKSEDISRTQHDFNAHGKQRPQLHKGHSMLSHIINDGYEGSYFIYLYARDKAPEMLSRLSIPDETFLRTRTNCGGSRSRTTRDILFYCGEESGMNPSS